MVGSVQTPLAWDGWYVVGREAASSALVTASCLVMARRRADHYGHTLGGYWWLWRAITTFPGRRWWCGRFGSSWTRRWVRPGYWTGWWGCSGSCTTRR